MNNPIVSIVTTCYNYARYVGGLAKSVAAQDIPYEWIVVDDASEDNPYAVLKSYEKQANLVYIRQPKNMGYSVGKNVGIRAAKADYICMIDADDVLLPGSLRSRYEVLQKNPDKLWVHAEAWDLHVDGKIGKPYPDNNRRRFAELSADKKDPRIWYTHRLVHAQTVMVKRAFHEQLGLYDESLRFSSDNEMWRRAIRFGIIPIYLREAVSLYRIHELRMCKSAYKKARIAQTKKYIVEIVERRFREGINTSNTTLLGARGK